MGVAVFGRADAGVCMRTGLALGNCITFGLCSNLGPSQACLASHLGSIVDLIRD